MMSIPVGTAVVNTPLVVVKKGEHCFHMFITCKDGSLVEHEPFSGDLKGMVSAINLSAEICAGKFFLNSVISDASKNTATAKLLSENRSAILKG